MLILTTPRQQGQPATVQEQNRFRALLADAEEIAEEERLDFSVIRDELAGHWYAQTGTEPSLHPTSY